MSQPLDHMGRYSLILRDGIPVPQFSVVAAPFYSICFNQSWLPAVASALKILARPEAWFGATPDDVRDAVSDGHTLLSNIVEGCGPGSVNWTPIEGSSLACSSSEVRGLFTVSLGEAPAPFRAFVGHATAPPIGLNFYSFPLHFRSLPLPGANVGGRILQLRVHQTGVVIGNVFSLVWRDCLGTLHSDTGIGQDAEWLNFDAQQICLSAGAAFYFSLVIAGSWICGPA